MLKNSVTHSMKCMNFHQGEIFVVTKVLKDVVDDYGQSCESVGEGSEASMQ